MIIDPRRWGIEPSYEDNDGHLRATPAPVAAALLEAMGADGGAPPEKSVTIAAPGQRAAVSPGTELHTEDGGVIPLTGRLPPDLPLGYHRLVSSDRERALIITPRRCFLPSDLHTWGWALQLYALRSHRSWGIGDLGDLRRVARWASRLGAGMMLINPLHAPAPGPTQQPSPYYPSSRCFRNPLYIDIESVTGAANADLDLDALAGAGRALNDDRRIDRDEIYRLKRAALEALWKRFVGDARFEVYRAEQGGALDDYATFVALAETYGAAWPEWPAGLRHPGAPGIARFRAERRALVDFHAWLQWLLDTQLESASSAGKLVHDLAIGVQPDGADAWIWQDAFAAGVNTGAPPDGFNPNGQDWGVLPFDPWKLATAGYEPFIATIRAAFRHAAGIRFDHVMGLFRLYWIPPGMQPTEGAYVRYPSDDLLDILALESYRARAYVVGEDLGTVEPRVRAEMAERAMLSYRLMWFEKNPPERWPGDALAAITTHDLPTIAGLWTGADPDGRTEPGVRRHDESELFDAVRSWLDVPPETPVVDIIEGLYRRLARAPSRIIAAVMEDALAVVERVNVPGTLSDRNWSVALPLSLEEIERHPGPARIASILGARRA